MGESVIESFLVFESHKDSGIRAVGRIKFWKKLSAIRVELQK